MTEPTTTQPAEPTEGEPTGQDPSNTPVEELTEPLEAEDDVHEQVALVNSSRPQDLAGGAA